MANEHISKKFDAELEGVRSRVLQMGGLVEMQITRAMDALARGDMELVALQGDAVTVWNEQAGKAYAALNQLAAQIANSK